MRVCHKGQPATNDTHTLKACTLNLTFHEQGDEISVLEQAALASCDGSHRRKKTQSRQTQTTVTTAQTHMSCLENQKKKNRLGAKKEIAKKPEGSGQSERWWG
jgi:hypothetical protein